MNKVNSVAAMEFLGLKRDRFILVSALRELRKQHPQWSLRVLHHVLQQGRSTCQLSLASVYRWCKALDRLQSMREDLQDTAFGGLWSSDVLQGPGIIIGGKKRKTYLLGIMDDASRFMISARFHLSEGIEPLMIDLRQALLRFGVPRRFYTDNDTAFHSRILHQVGVHLDIAIPHTQPYQAHGQGKIEHFFRTVREQFLDKATAKTLDQLNRDLQDWMVGYHRTPHEGIFGETPLDKRLRIESLCRNLPETVNIDALFLQSRMARIYRDGTFRLGNRLFEAPGARPANRVRIFFHPWDLSRVFYGQERWVARPLDRHQYAKQYEQPIRQEVCHE